MSLVLKCVSSLVHQSFVFDGVNLSLDRNQDTNKLIKQNDQMRFEFSSVQNFTGELSVVYTEGVVVNPHSFVLSVKNLIGQAPQLSTVYNVKVRYINNSLETGNGPPGPQGPAGLQGDPGAPTSLGSVSLAEFSDVEYLPTIRQGECLF